MVQKAPMSTLTIAIFLSIIYSFSHQKAPIIHFLSTTYLNVIYIAIRVVINIVQKIRPLCLVQVI